MYFCHAKTSEIDLIEDAIFGRIDDIGDMFKREVHLEFINNCLSKTAGHILPEYSYLHILVAHGPSERRSMPSNKCWKGILTSDDCGALERNGGFVLGFMLLSPNSQNGVHFIECIDTRVRGLNVARSMILKYENEVAVTEKIPQRFGVIQVLPKCVLPKDIASSSAIYWKKYFQRRYDINNLHKLQELCEFLGLREYVTWYHLEKLLEEPS